MNTITLSPEVQADFKKWYDENYGKFSFIHTAMITGADTQTLQLSFNYLPIDFQKGVYERYYRQRGIEFIVFAHEDSDKFWWAIWELRPNEDGKIVWMNTFTNSDGIGEVILTDHDTAFISAINRCGEIVGKETK